HPAHRGPDLRHQPHTGAGPGTGGGHPQLQEVHPRRGGREETVETSHLRAAGFAAFHPRGARMRQSTLAVLLVLGLAFTGCHHHRAHGPAPALPPPVAPATPPPAPPPLTPEIAPQVEDALAGLSSAELESRGLLADIHFDFDSADLRDADKPVLTQNADFLKSHDYIKVTVQGHCDERGTVEYNLALGERRAR